MDTKDYIIDEDLIKETNRAIGLPVCRKGESHPVGTVWFPKDYTKMRIIGSHRTKITIPTWLVSKKRVTKELLDGFDILTTF